MSSPILFKIVPGTLVTSLPPLPDLCKHWYADLARAFPFSACLQLAIPCNLCVTIASIYPTINGPKDAKRWSVRGFALHPKDALPTNMGFHHSFFTVRILTVGLWG